MIRRVQDRLEAVHRARRRLRRMKTFDLVAAKVVGLIQPKFEVLVNGRPAALVGREGAETGRAMGPDLVRGLPRAAPVLPDAMLVLATACMPR